MGTFQTLLSPYVSNHGLHLLEDHPFFCPQNHQSQKTRTTSIREVPMNFNEYLKLALSHEKHVDEVHYGYQTNVMSSREFFEGKGQGEAYSKVGEEEEEEEKDRLSSSKSTSSVSQDDSLIDIEALHPLVAQEIYLYIHYYRVLHYSTMAKESIHQN